MKIEICRFGSNLLNKSNSLDSTNVTTTQILKYEYLNNISHTACLLFYFYFYKKLFIKTYERVPYFYTIYLYYWFILWHLNSRKICICRYFKERKLLLWCQNHQLDFFNIINNSDLINKIVFTHDLYYC